MTPSTKVTGQRGEDLAVAYLVSQKYEVRERNARFGRLEIDIVAYDPREQMIVFVEVKARTTYDERYPVRTAVGRDKRRSLRRAISRWVHRHRYDGSARIDVVCVAEGRVIDHIINLGSDFF